MDKVKTSASEQWVDENGIVCVKYFDGATIDLKEIKKSSENISRLAGGNKELVFCDARSFFTITPEAQTFARKEIMNKSRTATAVVTNKSFVKLVVNFATSFFKLKSSVKMFSREKDAMKWLLSFQGN